MSHRNFLASVSPRILLPVVLALVPGLAPTSAAALGLGPVVVQSSLGQPLRVVVPIIAAPDDELSGECFKLATLPNDVDGVPYITQARLVLERTPAGAQLLLTTPRAVNEPIIRLAVQAGCDTAIRRDYTLLLDPAPIEPPVAAAETPRPAEPAAQSPGDTPAQTAAPRAAAATGAAGSPRAPSGSRQRDATRTTAAGAARAERLPRADRPPRARSKPAASGAGQGKPARAARAPVAPDRLRISGPSAAAVPGPGTGSSQAITTASEVKAQQDLALALEAETMVLRQRVTELTGMIDRMEQEMRAAAAARLAAEEAAKNAPLAIMARWWDANWAVVAGVLGLALAIAGILLWQRRRMPISVGEWPITSSTPDRFETSVIDEPPPLASALAGSVAVPQPIPRTAAGVGHAVAVSELSQVTEEARVYLALDRPDRAIEVLRRHISEQPTTMPAAWLMLLDLYRGNGREQDFRTLAEEFHLNFNVQTPQWETFAGHSPDDHGLEVFPHLIRQLSAIWGTEDCRSFLDRLLYDNRQGRRIGFSLLAYDDILTLRQLLELLLADSDSDEEAKLRSAWAAAQDAIAPQPQADEQGPAPKMSSPVPLALDLELDLDEVFDAQSPRSFLESEYPDLLRELTRDWGKAGAGARLRNMLRNDQLGPHPLPKEAVAELMLLEAIASEPAPQAKPSDFTVIPPAA